MSLQQRALSNLAENQALNVRDNLLKPGHAAPVAARPVLATRDLNVALQAGRRARSRLLAETKEKLLALEEAKVVAPAPIEIVVLPPHLLPLKPAPLPPNVIDIDEEDAEHLEFCTDYVKEVYEYLFMTENELPVASNYLDKHPSLRQHMRMILIEWLVSLQGRYKLLQETLLTTVSIMDRYMSLSRNEVSRSTFQLVGVACMLIACKYEEMYLPSVSDFVYMCDGAYTNKQLLWMERQILTTLEFRFSKPLTAHFLRRFSKAGGADSTTHTMAKYLLELALYEYSLVSTKPSLIAAAALCLSGSVTGVVSWDQTVQAYSRYSEIDLQPVAVKLAQLAAAADSNKYLKATYKKYATDKFQHVAESLCESSVVRRLAERS